MLDRLASRKEAWPRVGVPERIRLLTRVLDRTAEEAEAWAAAGANAQGQPPDSAIADEIRLTGPMVLARALRVYLDALAATGGTPLRVRRGADGRARVRVLPCSVWDRVLFPFTTCEVWTPPGVPPTIGRLYREKEEGRIGPGGITLVLGAGNISSIPPTDALHFLLVEDHVVLVKLHHITGWLRPILERIFAELIDAGFVAFVDDRPETTARLVDDPRVDALHLTGAASTYDAIVWGEGKEERERRRREADPRVVKRFTAELGCVTPVIVVPGDWSREDLRFQARSVAGMLQLNAGFNCNAPKVVVLARGWNRTPEFVAELGRALAALPERPAYYPGSRERWAAFRRAYPEARLFGRDVDGVIPWTLATGVPPREGEPAFEREAFCGVLAVTEIEGEDPPTFLPGAVELANTRLEGTLSCVLLADGKTLRRHRELFERAFRDLRYGTIGVNVWTGAVFGLMASPWGAYPGHAPASIGSGIGWVHNARMVDAVEKAVTIAPFRPPLKPLWFADLRTARGLGRRLIAFFRNPSAARIPALVWEAVRG